MFAIERSAYRRLSDIMDDMAPNMREFKTFLESFAPRQSPLNLYVKMIGFFSLKFNNNATLNL